MQTVISRSTRSPADIARRRCRGLMAASLLGTTFLVGAATSVALAAVADEDMVDITGLTAVGEGTLDNMRGGFSFGPFNVNFGLVIKTAINQQQVLMTSFKVETLGKIQDIKYDWQSYLHDNKPGGSNASSSSSQTAQTGAAAAGTDAPAPDLSGVQEQVETLTENPPTEESAQQAAEQLGQQAAAAAQQSAAAAQQAAAAAAQQAAEAAQQAVTQGTTPPADESHASTANNDPGTPDVGASDAAAAASDAVAFAVTQIENGVFIDNGQGTAIMQQINNGLVTEIINAANGATITHSTELNVFVSNFSDVVDRASLFQATSNLALEAIRNNPLLGQ